MPVSLTDPVLGLGLAAFALLLLALPLAFWGLSTSLAESDGLRLADGLLLADGLGLAGAPSSPKATGLPQPTANSGLVRVLVASANLALTAQLVLRWWQSGHFPISNLYESLCFLAWACTLTQLLVERSWPSALVPASATPMGLGCVAFASFALPDQLQAASPLVPALRSSWLVMHVSVIMVSYAALLVGSLLSLAVLFTDRGRALEVRSSSIGSGGYRQGLLATSPSGGPSPALSLQSAAMGVSEQLDSLSYRTITVGFLLLSVGIVSGAVWANEAWGSWWSWDPKETWALICWLVYAAYLHTRLSRGWQGRRPALVAVAGLVVICVCYIGVNLLGIGLHSYGWFFDS